MHFYYHLTYPDSHSTHFAIILEKLILYGSIIFHPLGEVVYWLEGINISGLVQTLLCIVLEVWLLEYLRPSTDFMNDFSAVYCNLLDIISSLKKWK